MSNHNVNSRPDKVPIITTEQRNKVLFSFENARYKWRTISGVARETNLPKSIVVAIIDKEKNKIVQSTIPSNSGQRLFTTRRHFRKKSSFLERLSAAFKNRAS